MDKKISQVLEARGFIPVVHGGNWFSSARGAMVRKNLGWEVFPINRCSRIVRPTLWGALVELAK